MVFFIVIEGSHVLHLVHYIKTDNGYITVDNGDITMDWQSNFSMTSQRAGLPGFHFVWNMGQELCMCEKSDSGIRVESEQKRSQSLSTLHLSSTV